MEAILVTYFDAHDIFYEGMNHLGDKAKWSCEPSTTYQLRRQSIELSKVLSYSALRQMVNCDDYWQYSDF